MTTTTLSTITWTVARAGGMTAFALLTLSVVLGLALSMRWQTPRWPRLITNEMHNFLTTLSLVFIAVHGVAIWLDPFMGFSWTEIFVPLASHYRPLWIALGIVAGYLGIAIWISTYLRPWIGYTVWRKLHILTFVIYLLTLAHGIGTGSDTRTLWAMALYGGSMLSIGGLLVARLLTPIGAKQITHPRLATLSIAIIAGLVLWSANGPLQPGWNAIANNGQGSGSRLATTTAAATLPTPFTSSLQGQLIQSTATATGAVTLHLQTTLSDATRRPLDITIVGEPSGDGNLLVSSTHLTLGATGALPAYDGQLTTLQTDQIWQLGAVLSPQQTHAAKSSAKLRVQIALQVAPNGQVSGQIQGTPVAATTQSST